MDKIDVAIITRDAKAIHPKLLEVLNSVPWVDHIIIEDSKPLSWARVRAARKATGEFFGMLDDDAVLTKLWYPTLAKYIDPEVLAVSSPSLEANNIHLVAYKRLSDKLIPLKDRVTPFIDNTLIRRETLANFKPMTAYLMEDEILYRYIIARGKWVHTPYIGVRHYVFFSKGKAPMINAIVMAQWGGFPFTSFVKGRASRFLLPIPAMGYSHTWRTVPFFWKKNVEFIAGWMKGITNKKGEA